MKCKKFDLEKEDQGQEVKNWTCLIRQEIVDYILMSLRKIYTWQHMFYVKGNAHTQCNVHIHTHSNTYIHTHIHTCTAKEVGHYKEKYTYQIS